MSTRRKSQTDYLLMNKCPRIRTRIGQNDIQTLYQKGRLAQLNKIKGEYKLAVLVYTKKIGWGNAKGYL
jgi:hypothetical protein